LAASPVKNVKDRFQTQVVIINALKKYFSKQLNECQNPEPAMRSGCVVVLETQIEDPTRHFDAAATVKYVGLEQPNQFTQQLGIKREITAKRKLTTENTIAIKV